VHPPPNVRVSEDEAPGARQLLAQVIGAATLKAAEKTKLLNLFENKTRASEPILHHLLELWRPMHECTPRYLRATTVEALHRDDSSSSPLLKSARSLEADTGLHFS
jgi:hypothetical protein